VGTGIMARVLEAKRVLVQETEERRTLNPHPLRSGSNGTKGGDGMKISTIQQGLGNEKGGRRALQRMGVESTQQGESDMHSGPKSAARPESPTSTTTKFSEIFGPDVQEGAVVSQSHESRALRGFSRVAACYSSC
jgi:hypothetical protein